MPTDEKCDVDVEFTTGYKDDYKFIVCGVEDPWAPTVETLFEVIAHWFEAEDVAFEDGYGCKWPLLYIGMIAIGEKEEAMEAANMEGYDALRHFERCREEYGDEIAEFLGL